MAVNSSPRQRVVISDDYTSWLLKGEGTERYGDGEAKVAQAGGGSIWLNEVHR